MSNKAKRAVVDVRLDSGKLGLDIYTYGDGSAAIRLGSEEHAPIAFLNPDKVKFVVDALTESDGVPTSWSTYGEEIIRRPWYYRPNTSEIAKAKPTRLSAKDAPKIAETLWRMLLEELQLPSNVTLTVCKASLLNDTVTLRRGNGDFDVKLENHIYSLVTLIDEDDLLDIGRLIDRVGRRHVCAVAERINHALAQHDGRSVELVLGAPKAPAIGNLFLATHEGARWLVDYDPTRFEDRSLFHTYMGIKAVEG